MSAPGEALAWMIASRKESTPSPALMTSDVVVTTVGVAIVTG